MRIKLDEINKKINEMNKKQKIGMLLVACCFGIIILGGIANTVAPDQNTNNNDKSDIFNTPQEKHYTPNITDNFTYMGEDCNDISKDGYQYGLTDNEGRYCRFDDDIANKIAQVDNSTKDVYRFEFMSMMSNSGSFDYDGFTIGGSGLNHIIKYNARTPDKVQFSYECENGNFTFTTEQKDISILKNQTVITEVYYSNGTPVKYDSELV